MRALRPHALRMRRTRILARKNSMDISLAHRLLHLLGQERRLVHYWPGREASLLFRLAFPDGARIADVKRTRFAPLLHRPQVKAVMASSGDGALDADRLDAWPASLQWYCYALGFSLWGGAKKGRSRYTQVSRPGVSLALLLNFSGAHDEYFTEVFGADAGASFTCRGHPHAPAASGRRTCAWVRIDIAPETGEALIEEVQNDWLRQAHEAYEEACANRARTDACVWVGRDAFVEPARVIRYWEERGALHDAVWKEAALTAALSFLIETVGVRTIWMHTAATGARLKRIDGRRPPRSVYEDAPRRFCFERTTDAPRFLLDGVSKPTRRFLRSAEAEFWRHQF